tara:strand:+ start:580 stop:1122 length:543 start_codon:yes stop_codon:yes gene_type:complete
MRKFLFLISLFIIEPVFSYESYGDYKKLNFFKYLDNPGLRIIDLVDQTNKPYYFIKENTPTCKSGDYGGYVYGVLFGPKEYEYVICTRTLYFNSSNNSGFFKQINRVVRHEAAHAAQICKQGDFSIGVEKWKFKGYPERMVYNHPIYRGISKMEQLMELEAFAVEDDPYFVLNSVGRFCF